MSDIDPAASNAAMETQTAVEASPAPVADEAPSSTAREAIERAFRAVDGQPRDDVGKWTAKPEEDAPKLDQGQKAPAAPAVEQPAKMEEPVAQVGEPPARFSPEAKAAWASVPDVVRAETERAVSELTRGLEQYRQRFEPLKQFDDMAREGGTSLDRALASYVGLENMIRENPVAGFLQICQNGGIDPVQIGQALAGIQSGGGSSPEVAPLLMKIQQLEQQIGNVHQTFQQREAQAAVEDFAAKNPRFDELAPEIEQMLRTGYAKDLQDAYNKANLVNPAPVASAPAIPMQTARPQTPRPVLQITGSPSAGSDPSTRKPAGSPSEALSRAFEAVGL